MSVKLTWIPNTNPDIYQYELQRADDVSGQPGTFADLVTITHDLNGTDYDSVSGRFFYVDTTGTTDNWYRLRAVNTNGVYSAYSNPFQPSESTTPPPFDNTVILDEDYGGENELQLTDLNGDPIENAQVRVYKKIDYDLENYEAAVGVTTTDAAGGWVNPIMVEAGFTYTIHFFKPNAYGPATVEIIVP